MIDHDDDLVSEFLADLLSTFGRQAFFASGGLAVVAMIQGGCRPDLVPIDLEMEQMDGFGAIDTVQAAHPDMKASFAMLTANVSDEAAVEGRRHGAVVFLSKPVRADQLNTPIGRFLNDAKLVWLDDHHTVIRAA